MVDMQGYKEGAEEANGSGALRSRDLITPNASR